MNNKDLLKAVDEYRNGGAQPGSIEWDTLMYFFEEPCRDYMIGELCQKDLTDDEIADMVNSPLCEDYYCQYLDMYLCN